jgi:hypothetical protein
MGDENVEKIIRGVVNGLASFKTEITEKIDGLDVRLNKRIDGLEERLDKIGGQLAYLEDDAPIREEFDDFGKKVDRHISTHSRQTY